MRHCILVGAFLCSAAVSAQPNAPGAPDRHWADSTLAVLRNSHGSAPKETNVATDRLLAVYGACGDSCALAEVNGIRSTTFGLMGSLDSAMACAHRAFRLFRPSCDSTVLIRGYVAMTVLYLALDEFARVDSLCTAGLALWRQGWKPISLRNSLLTNRAIALARTGDLAGAEAMFRTILNLSMVEHSPQDIEDANSNLGVMKNMTGDLDSAVYFYSRALASARANGKAGRMAIQFSNLANVAEHRKDLRKAISLLDSALTYATLANDLAQQKKVHWGLSRDYHALGDDASAYSHLLRQGYLSDSLLNAEKVKSIAEMQAKYERVNQDKEISLLRAENLTTELEKTQVQRTRNIFLFVALAVLGIAIALLSRLHYMGRSRLAIRQEKSISDELLHNILPEEVADEIREKGYADVHEFEKATILFTDFKDFTQLSEKFTAQELVAEIDHCFKAFDGIVEAHGIEKIKTIGDAYMAAGGLPDKHKGHPLQTVLAALDMAEFMRAYQEQRKAEGRQYFVMRTGLHTGPVIAGIVGVKKYAYDIWGDTVNVANRMETSGEVGKVNISQTTYDIVKNEPGLRFTPRGAVQAKGKGMLNMYFVERA